MQICYNYEVIYIREWLIVKLIVKIKQIKIILSNTNILMQKLINQKKL